MSEQKTAFEKMLKTTLKFIGETLWNIVSILLIVIILRTFIATPFHVSGSSMTSTLQNNDYIIIEKITDYFTPPKFGNIIVFTPPQPRMRQVVGPQCWISQVSAWDFSKEACFLPDFFIKRIIGEPGDVIEIKDGEVYRNGELLPEDYLDDFNAGRTFVPSQTQYAKYTVPEGRYFVLGDNRNGSSDSRAHAREWQIDGKYDPYVFLDDIEGRFFFRLISPVAIQTWMKK